MHSQHNEPNRSIVENISSLQGVSHIARGPPAPRDTTSITVGIDFGTARSGYAISLNGQEISVQQQYGEHHSPLQCKTQTLILYRTTGRTWEPVAFGSKAEHE